MRKKRKKYREQINEESREERRKVPQKIKVSEDAGKVGHAWEQHKNELGPRKTYEEAATEDDIGLTIRCIDEVRDALDQAQSLEETPTPLNLGLTRTFKIFGHIHLLWNAAFNFDGFTPSEHCSTKAHNFGTSQEPVYIQFFNDNYLTLKISRELVYANFDDDDIPCNAPSLFTYYGISEKDMVDKEQQEEEQWETDGESVIKSIRVLF